MNFISITLINYYNIINVNFFFFFFVSPFKEVADLALTGQHPG